MKNKLIGIIFLIITIIFFRFTFKIYKSREDLSDWVSVLDYLCISVILLVIAIVFLSI